MCAPRRPPRNPHTLAWTLWGAAIFRKIWISATSGDTGPRVEFTSHRLWRSGTAIPVATRNAISEDANSGGRTNNIVCMGMAYCGPIHTAENSAHGATGLILRPLAATFSGSPDGATRCISLSHILRVRSRTGISIGGRKSARPLRKRNSTHKNGICGRTEERRDTVDFNDAGNTHLL